MKEKGGTLKTSYPFGFWLNSAPKAVRQSSGYKLPLCELLIRIKPTQMASNASYSPHAAPSTRLCTSEQYERFTSSYRCRRQKGCLVHSTVLRTSRWENSRFGNINEAAHDFARKATSNAAYLNYDGINM